MACLPSERWQPGGWWGIDNAFTEDRTAGASIEVNALGGAFDVAAPAYFDWVMKASNPTNLPTKTRDLSSEFEFVGDGRAIEILRRPAGGEAPRYELQILAIQSEDGVHRRVASGGVKVRNPVLEAEVRQSVQCLLLWGK